MARANYVKKARKAIKGTDIKKGDSYYWWKFRFGGKRVSKTPPRRSQLTQSAFYGTVYDIEDDIAACKAEDGDGIASCIEDAVSNLRQLAEECEEKHSNMPDSLQGGETGQMLQERAEACNNAADELENIDVDPDGREDGQTVLQFWEGVVEELQNISIDAP